MTVQTTTPARARFTIAGALLLSAAAALRAEPPPPVPPPSRAEAPNPTGELALRDAVAAALVGSPELDAFSLDVRVAEARALQAGALPNPQLGLEVENVGGTGRRQAFEQTETTVFLRQLFQLGGTRAARRRAADLERELAAWQYEAARLAALTATQKAFVATLAAQERLALADERVAAASDKVSAAAERTAAGAAAPTARRRAEVELATIRLERRRLEQELAARRAALAATWGATHPAFSRVRGDLEPITPPPPLGALEAHLDDNPDVARFATEIDRRLAMLDLARADRIPDPLVGVGSRHFAANDDTALVFEVSLPLPVFDRNAGAILAAGRDVEQAEAKRRATETSLRAELARAHAECAAAWARATDLAQEVLPTARASADAVRAQYRAGSAGRLEVLEAEHAVIDVRAQRLETLVVYHDARADLDRLTGGTVDDVQVVEGAR